jgi:hypothetical protein
MPKSLEDKLKRKYGAKSATPYKIMNKMGVMKGSKETPKGKKRDTESHMYNFRNRHGQAKIT